MIVRPGFTDGLKWVFSDEKWDTEANTTNYADYGIFAILLLICIIRLKKAFLLSRKKNS